MKACIVEIRGNRAAALTNDGSVIKVRNRNYGIGQVFEIKKFTFSAKAAGITAAAAAVLLFFCADAWAYFTPCTYVSLDVNPSIEYSVNRFDRVLSAKAVDSDAKAILNGLNLDNKTIDAAVGETVDKIESRGYFYSDDPGDIIIATSGDDAQAASHLADELKTTAEDAVKTSGSNVEVEATSVGRSRVLEAQKLGTTPGKLNLVQKLQASVQDPASIDVQEWLKKPVKDIMKAIKAGRKQANISSGTGGSESSRTGENVSGDVTSEAPENPSPNSPKAPTVSGRAVRKPEEKSKPSADRSPSSVSPQVTRNTSSPAKPNGNSAVSNTPRGNHSSSTVGSSGAGQNSAANHSTKADQKPESNESSEKTKSNESTGKPASNVNTGKGSK